MDNKYYKITFDGEVYYTNDNKDVEYYMNKENSIIEEIEEWEYDTAKEEEVLYSTNRY